MDIIDAMYFYLCEVYEQHSSSALAAILMVQIVDFMHNAACVQHDSSMIAAHLMITNVKLKLAQTCINVYTYRYTLQIQANLG